MVVSDWGCLFMSLPVYLYKAELPSQCAVASKADVEACMISLWRCSNILLLVLDLAREDEED
jgi:hypothetical protein